MANEKKKKKKINVDRPIVRAKINDTLKQQKKDGGKGGDWGGSRKKEKVGGRAVEQKFISSAEKNCIPV